MQPKISRLVWAVRQMRHFQGKEEEARSAVTDHRDKVKTQLKDNYIRTGRETFGALDETVTQLANNDSIGKTMIGDEQFYRGLAHMYAQIALVELAIEEKAERESSNSVRHAHPLRTG